jgi:putative endonuclease
MLYLIRITPPLGNEKKRAQFYLGYCKRGRLEERFKEHLSGQGAAMTRYAVQNGHQLEIVWTAQGSRKKERKLKKRRNHKRLLED